MLNKRKSKNNLIFLTNKEIGKFPNPNYCFPHFFPFLTISYKSKVFLSSQPFYKNQYLSLKGTGSRDFFVLNKSTWAPYDEAKQNLKNEFCKNKILQLFCKFLLLRKN